MFVGVHEFEHLMRSDEEYVSGALSYLVQSNHFRLLDGRKLPE